MCLSADRFFTGQNGRTSCTPHNPFSLAKSTGVVADTSVARKLNLSLIHNQSVDGEHKRFDTSEHLQSNDIDIIEQSPLKEACNGHVENMERTLSLDDDEVSIIITEPPSSPVTINNPTSSSDEMNEEEDSEIKSPSQLEQVNINTTDEGEDATHEMSIESVVEQNASTVTKKFGHRDLREFAFKRKSEREQRPSSHTNKRNHSLPNSYITSQTPNRKIMSSEDFLCPLEHKKHKTVAKESEDTTAQVDPVQCLHPDKSAVKNVSPLKRVICLLCLLPFSEGNFFRFQTGRHPL